MFELKNVFKSYDTYSEASVLNDINLVIKRNQIVALMGPSGSGKTTLLNLISGIDSISSGNIYFDNQNITKLNEDELSEFRMNNIGIVFQFFNLIDDLTVIENVSLPLLIDNVNYDKVKQEANRLLISLGLEKLKNRRTNLLSGGESQRVALARALITKPSLILADEPTGNLDKENTQKTIDLLVQTCKDNETSLLMVTHDDTHINKFDVVYHLESGKIIAT